VTFVECKYLCKFLNFLSKKNGTFINTVRFDAVMGRIHTINIKLCMIIMYQEGAGFF